MKELINNTIAKEQLPYDELYEDKFFYKKIDTLEKAQDLLDHISEEFKVLRDSYRQCKKDYLEHSDLQEYEALKKKERGLKEEIEELNSFFNKKAKEELEIDLVKVQEEIETLKNDPRIKTALDQVEAPMLEADEEISKAAAKKDFPFMATNQVVIPYLKKKIQLKQELAELEVGGTQELETEIEQLYKELADCENQVGVAEKEAELEQAIAIKESKLRTLPRRIARLQQSISDLEATLDKNVLKFRLDRFGGDD